MNRELKILKWVGIALACLTTVFTLVIVGSHLSGRLVGMGKIGIIGTVGAELMCIVCGWLAASDRKIIAGVSMLCQIVLTAILLINATIALDLDWQETQASRAEQSRIEREKQTAEEQRKTIATEAQLAAQLAVTDKRLAREFVKTRKTTEPQFPALSEPEKTSEPQHVNIANLSTYERYGLTVVPLFLALLTVVALGLAAHSAGSYSPIKTESNFPEFLQDMSVRESRNHGQLRSYAGNRVADLVSGVATQPATQSDGLAILRQALRDFAAATPGQWFKVDVRSDHVLIRLNQRNAGREETVCSGKLTLAVLTDAERMSFAAFRQRLKKLLVRKGFPV